VTALESSTKVQLGGTRGGPDKRTLRQDHWGIQPFAIVVLLSAFVIYTTWAAFQNRYYFVGANFHRDLISPLDSPCIGGTCVPGAKFAFTWSWWKLSPALLILAFPGGFRLTCYYYRRSYYRGFWRSPPSCAVADDHTNYSGETRFPLFYIAFVFNILLTYDAVLSFHQPGLGWGVTVGTIVLTANATLLWLYTLSCHACRHLCGGQVRSFKAHPLRYRLWKLVSPLNAKHMNFAWASLLFVAFTDVYIRLVASGAITDYKLF
jgi:hypothetical protein